jgi:hypothetical protein
MSPSDGNRILSYSAPRILYQAEFRSLGVQTVLAFAMCIGGAAIFIGVGISREGLSSFTRPSFAWGGIAWLVLAAIILHRWFYNEKTLLQITDEGVQYGRNMWQWGLIHEVGGYRRSGGIQLFVSLRPDVHPIIKASFRQELPISSKLSQDEFQRLIEQLKLFGSESFSHVHFEFELQTPPWT